MSSTTFPYTGAVQQIVAPLNRTEMTVTAMGANGNGSRAGKGGLIIAAVPCTPGATYDVYVGGVPRASAAAGWPNGGQGGTANNQGDAGGGATYIVPAGGAVTAALVVAGAGGGQSDSFFNVGNGGNGGYPAGTVSGSPYDPCQPGTATVGGYGSYEDGDTDGAGFGGDGQAAGAVAKAEGGGGGGGWHGGGGGSTSGASAGGEGGAGAGGSSYMVVGGTLVSDATGYNTVGDGELTVDFVAEPVSSGRGFNLGFSFLEVVPCTFGMSFAGSVTDSTHLFRESDAKFIKNGDYMYFVAGGYFTVVDVSGPTTPTVVGWVVEVSGNLSSLDHGLVWDGGNYVYVGTGYQGHFTVVDVSDPTTPTIAASIRHANAVATRAEMRIVGNYVIGFDFIDHAVWSVDVTDPTMPIYADWLTDATNRPSPDFGVALDGDYLYCYGNDGVGGVHDLLVYDISDPTAIAFHATLDLSSYIDVQYTSIIKDGNYLYTTGTNDDIFVVVDVSNPAAPTYAGSIVDSANMKGPEYGLLKDGDYVYVVGNNNWGTFTVVDVSSPSTPTIAGSYVGLASPNHLILSHASFPVKYGNYVLSVAYSGDASDNGSVLAFDVSDPTNPVLTTLVDIPGTTLDNPSYWLAVDGDYLYIRDFEHRLTVVSLCAP